MCDSAIPRVPGLLPLSIEMLGGERFEGEGRAIHRLARGVRRLKELAQRAVRILDDQQPAVPGLADGVSDVLRERGDRHGTAVVQVACSRANRQKSSGTNL